jgi:hypothetical protein
MTDDVHTFVPSRREARSESLVAAVVAAGLVVGYLYLGQGERDPRLLAGLGALAAALLLVGYMVRSHFQWVDEIRLTPEGVTLVRDETRQTLPWTAVKSIRHLGRGGEQWILSTHPGHRPMTIRADGLTRDDAARLRELIPALHAAAQEEPESAAP